MFTNLMNFKKWGGANAHPHSHVGPPLLLSLIIEWRLMKLWMGFISNMPPHTRALRDLKSSDNAQAHFTLCWNLTFLVKHKGSNTNLPKNNFKRLQENTLSLHWFYKIQDYTIKYVKLGLISWYSYFPQVSSLLIIKGINEYY